MGSLRGTVLHRLSLCVVLTAVWLLWSGHYKPLFLGFGAFSVGLVLFLSIRMNVVDDEGAPLDIPFRALAYVPWLVVQILLANVSVIRCILTPGRSISPRMVRIDGKPQTQLGRAILANSITLTPGTVTVDVDDDHYDVHALTEAAARDLESGAMEARVCRVEGQR